MKQDNQISSILSPEVEIQGDVKVTGSILIYGKTMILWGLIIQKIC